MEVASANNLKRKKILSNLKRDSQCPLSVSNFSSLPYLSNKKHIKHVSILTHLFVYGTIFGFRMFFMDFLGGTTSISNQIQLKCQCKESFVIEVRFI